MSRWMASGTKKFIFAGVVVLVAAAIAVVGYLFIHKIVENKQQEEN